MAVKKFVVRAQPWFLKPAVEFTTSSDEVVCFGDVLRIAIAKFGLDTDNMYMFGLFELHPNCLPMIPLKLYMDYATPTKEEYLNLGVMKLCFDRVAERSLIRNDGGLAIELFYLETKSLHELGTMVGSPKDIAEATNERLLKYTVKRKKLRQHVPKLVQHVFVPPEEEKYLRQLKRKDGVEYTMEDCLMFAAGVKDHSIVYYRRIMYMETMHCLNRFYWSYFHKVVGCTLCGDFAKVMAPYMNLNDRFEVVVTLNRTCLSILGVTTANQFLHLVDFPWISIHSVKMNPAEKTFSFHVLYEGKKKHYANLVTISIRTDYFEYLYTMALYLLQMHENLLPLVDFKTPHVLTSKEFRAILFVKPLSIDHDNFLCMILPLDFLRYLGGKATVEPLEICALPKAKDVVPPEVMEINAMFRFVAFRLKQVKVTPEQTEAENGYLKVICGKNTCSIPFYTSDTVAKFFNCSKIHLPINTISRVVTIHTFVGAFKIPIYHYDMSVKEFNAIVSNVIHLRKGTHTIFMLYSFEKHGSLHFSTRVYLYDDYLSDDSHYVFRRSGFYTKAESFVWQVDLSALDMLYYEAKHLFENDVVFPKIGDDKIVAELKHIAVSIEEKKLSSEEEEKRKMTFLSTLSGASTYWWLHYHHTHDAKFPNIDKFTKELFNQPPQTQIGVATLSLAYDGLCLLDAAGAIQRTICTYRIRAVLLENSHTLVFEIYTVVQSKDEELETIIIPLVCISKVAQSYLFFITKHIFALFILSNKHKSAGSALNKFENHYFGPTIESQGVLAQYVNSSSSAQ